MMMADHFAEEAIMPHSVYGDKSQMEFGVRVLKVYADHRSGAFSGFPYLNKLSVRKV